MNAILGTMTFGEQIFESEAIRIIDAFLERGYNRLDTAYVYNGGESERIIGKCLKNLSREKLLIDTKANPRVTGKLDAHAIRHQLEESLRRLNIDYIDCFYLHFPDRNVPIEEAAETVNSLFEEGKIKEFGLSNYPLELVEKVTDICQLNGWICPTVYEGLYNPLSRKAEVLDPLLSDHSIRFFSYNPLAGGLLTNKYSSYEEAPGKGRFSYRPNYQKRYWKKEFFDALKLLKTECEKYEIGITEAALRWLSHSSMLKDIRKDAVIIGISKTDHLNMNLESIEKEVLPEGLISSFDLAWDICKEEAPEYFRFFGDDGTK